MMNALIFSELPILSGLDHLRQKFGLRFDGLSHKQKAFAIAALSLHLLGSHSLDGAIDELDPNGEHPADFLLALSQLAEGDRRQLWQLLATLSNLLADCEPSHLGEQS